jgi:hypothetical protein
MNPVQTMKETKAGETFTTEKVEIPADPTGIKMDTMKQKKIVSAAAMLHVAIPGLKSSMMTSFHT